MCTGRERKGKSAEQKENFYVKWHSARSQSSSSIAMVAKCDPDLLCALSKAL